jgi:hypothetical protein
LPELRLALLQLALLPWQGLPQLHTTTILPKMLKPRRKLIWQSPLKNHKL